MKDESKSWTWERVRIHRTDGDADAVFFANGVHRMMKICEIKSEEIDEALGLFTGTNQTQV